MRRRHEPNPWDDGLAAIVIALLYSLDVGLRRLVGVVMKNAMRNDA